ncbi:MAG: SH3 domain-containing protein [Candidatus Neomarinimicrobiota bacterium]
MNRLSIIFLLFISLQANYASHADSLFVEANKRYSMQDYVNALGVYEQLISQGYEHSNLYYNLGNTYYQLAELGNAIWAYEKGLFLRPSDDDLVYNLSIANARIVDRIIIPEPFFFVKLYSSFKQIFSPNQWLYVISCLILLTSIFSTIGRIWKNRTTHLITNFSSFIIALGFISFFIFVDVYYDLSNDESGVVTVKEGRVYSAPSKSSNLLFVVHEGTKAKISSRQNPWVEIQLIDGKKGWLSLKNMRLL